MNKEQMGILCQINMEQIVYVSMTHVVGIRSNGESYEVNHPRYITLDKSKAIEYFEACKEYVLMLEKADKAFDVTISENKIAYSFRVDGRQGVVNISMGEYFLDFALSEF